MLGSTAMIGFGQVAGASFDHSSHPLDGGAKTDIAATLHGTTQGDAGCEPQWSALTGPGGTG
ncbi:MAG: hypothetical protein LAT64_01315 [Phycisphaerales bacterium]|nr:hypothetical protein [Planctomycetota bacterium]MCH8507401.1 hypothetical protein [Phycisphaerales bacterium]